MNLEIESNSVRITQGIDTTVAWGTVDYWETLEDGYRQGLKVEVLLTDLSVPATDLSKIALEKANAFVKALAEQLSK
jgi:hypothetical protein